MPRYLVLRLDAPLISFGATMVDQNGVIQDFPTLSMLTGLIANALGWDHADTDKLADLQGRIDFGARADHPGQRLQDFQTADLGQAFLSGTGWTTWGYRQDREGGTASHGTHIRERDYHADHLSTVVLTLRPGLPDLDDVASAIARPERPLFIGRKGCLPSRPLLDGFVEATSILSALENVPPLPGRTEKGRLKAWWPTEEPDTLPVGCRVVAVTDERDWVNQIHVGRRWFLEGFVTPQEGAAS